MNIPEKSFFKIGEVAKLLDVEAYVLRYWESEFDLLVPEKTKSGQRIYQRDDIVLLARIRDLLYVDMYTIAGARRQLERPDLANSGDGVEQTGVEPGDEGGSQEELVALQADFAELQSAHEALTDAYTALKAGLREAQAQREASDAAAGLAYETVCDERDVLVAQLEALQLENETLHLSVIPAESVAASEEKTRELFEVIARLETELREAHRVSDELRDYRQEQLSLQEQNRRNTLLAMRLELEELAGLAEGRLSN